MQNSFLQIVSVKATRPRKIVIAELYVLKIVFHPGQRLHLIPAQNQGGASYSLGKKPSLNRLISHVNLSLDIYFGFSLSIYFPFFVPFLYYCHVVISYIFYICCHVVISYIFYILYCHVVIKYFFHTIIPC